MSDLLHKALFDDRHCRGGRRGLPDVAFDDKAARKLLLGAGYLHVLQCVLFFGVNIVA